MSHMKQLALDIGLAPVPTLARFFPGSNEAVLQHLRLAVESDSGGALRAAVPMYLWGESGCGKTHLLRAAYEALREQGQSVGWLDASVSDATRYFKATGAGEKPVTILPMVTGVVSGAVAGTGGWLVRAPGTPPAAWLTLADSLFCWLRMLVLSGVLFGRKLSAVCSVCEKSTCCRMQSLRKNRWA